MEALKIGHLKVDAGEGSRGGKIVGHTRSGKPIYMNAKHQSHQGFTRVEHLAAAKVHNEIVAKRKAHPLKHGFISEKEVVSHNKQAGRHEKFAKKATF